MKNVPEIILASRSPDRRLILEKTGLPFRVVESAYDEDSCCEYDPVERATILAREKARRVAKSYPNMLVIGGDTVIMGPDRVLLEKPLNDADAVRMTRAYSGKKCTVVTGHCMVHSAAAKEEQETVCLDIEYHPISEDEVREYIESHCWEGMSGAINIDAQHERGWVKELPEDIDGIRGLSLKALMRLFQRMGYGGLVQETMMGSNGALRHY